METTTNGVAGNLHAIIQEIDSYLADIEGEGLDPIETCALAFIRNQSQQNNPNDEQVLYAAHLLYERVFSDPDLFCEDLQNRWYDH
ncbi:MAG: hypothetical protein HRU40_20775 [Saprospiraceae bacterium]|nr:hypothetical protein [Saprospiraceae bacterium]